MQVHLWIEATQEDFKDGNFERNIYAPWRKEGAVEFVPRFDLNNDGYLDVYISEIAGTTTIYWGSSSGFSIYNKQTFFTYGGENCDGADINWDNYPEFSVSPYGANYLIIFQGEKDGPNANNRLLLNKPPNAEACFWADFNKDGYLDIVIETQGIIFWGDTSGFIPNTPLFDGNTNGANIEVADLNKDGWLDIIFPAAGDWKLGIFWGGKNGYSSSNVTYLPTHIDPHGLSVADLNKDGWLDIILFRGGFKTHRQIIYWNSPHGFSENNKTDVGVSIEASGSTVMDFNYDGKADYVVNARVSSDSSYVVWGDEFSNVVILPLLIILGRHGLKLKKKKKFQIL